MKHHDWLAAALAIDNEAGEVSMLPGPGAAEMARDGVAVAAPVTSSAPASIEKLS